MKRIALVQDGVITQKYDLSCGIAHASGTGP